MQKILHKDLPYNLELHEYSVQAEDFRESIVKGLTQPQKILSPKFFYDHRGSQLFEEITRLDEYYLTQTELDIFNRHKKNILNEIRDQSIIVEPGSGNSEKITDLLEAFPNFCCYVPIEISRNHLLEYSSVLAKKFPEIHIIAVASDYMNSAFNLDDLVPEYQNPLIFFPGSSIGNYDAGQAAEVLKRFIQLMHGPGKLLIGVDLKKDTAILEKAYNDKKGLTANFNLNALYHIKRELGLKELNPGNFRHSAWYNSKFGRIEMHLVSKTDQEFYIGEIPVQFNKGETIHTESSYKYTVEEFSNLASKAGLTLQNYWTDPKDYYSVQLYSYG